jgi:hypothetical protein
VPFEFSTTAFLGIENIRDTSTPSSVVPAETLYDFGSGTYKFRAVTESTTDSTLPLYCKAYIQLTKDSDKLLSSDDIKTTVAAEYKEATEMPGFNA